MNRQQIANEAAEWLFKLEDDPRHEASAEFVAWLKRSPQHMGEFLFATAAWKTVQAGDPQKTIALDDVADAAPDNIVALSQPTTNEGRYPRSRSRSRWVWTAVAATVLLTMGALSWQLLSRTDSELYQTKIGEQSAVKLDDGSILHLNTQSRARVSYSTGAREIRLLEGEALFTVTRDTQRPFRVYAGAAVIQAVGTQFNVYRRAGTTTVSVIEGRVEVVPESAHAATLQNKNSSAAMLSAGEEAQVTEDRRIAKRARDLTPALAWRQRRLVFEATPLPEVAREFNRYNRPQLLIEGDHARTLQITGVFNADEPTALLNFLRDDAALDIRTLEEGSIIRSR